MGMHAPEPLLLPIATLAQESLINQTHINKYDILFRLCVAAFFGGLMGWERERADKPVGVRTMLLVSTGAAAFTLLGEQVITTTQDSGLVQIDPTRVLSYIITGVGFLGAGAIMQSKETVKGLTTATSIWVAAAVGAAVGLGQFMIGFLVFAITFVALWSPWVKDLLTGRIEQEQSQSKSDNTDSIQEEETTN